MYLFNFFSQPLRILALLHNPLITLEIQAFFQTTLHEILDFLLRCVTSDAGLTLIQ